MKQKLWIATVAATLCAPIFSASSRAVDELEKTLLTPPAPLSRESIDASTQTLRPALRTSTIQTSSPVPLVPENNLAPESTENAEGDIVVRNAKVEIPMGEGYEATISANGQGLLAELGLCELGADGEPVLGEDGTTKRQTLRRGLAVRKGDVLGKLQDDELTQDRIVATQELLVAEKEAAKTLEVEVAEAAARVAQASYKRASSLNDEMPGAVSPEEVQEKYYEWIRASKSIEKAKYDLEVNQEKVKVAKARVNAADVQINNRKFRSPIDGIIDDVMQNEGQWLREGDPVVRILRLDKVQVTGAIRADLYAPEAIDGKACEITVTRPGLEPQTLPGKIVYVRQIVESGHYYFYADVANKLTDSGYWLLNPGALVTVTIR